MRCPKCGFISFDMVESCTKCGKNINKAAEELKGTTADVDLPLFLNLDYNSYEESAEEETAAEEEVMDLDIGGEEEMVDFSLEEEEAAAVEEEVDFTVEEETAAEPDTGVDVELGEPEEKEKALDISDLGPAEEEIQEAEEELAAPVEDEFTLEAEPAAAEEPAAEAPEEEAREGGGELEDLEVEGIDLESSSAPKSGKVMPSVKTGTALDDFDIDLGDLISPKKEESGD